MKIFYHPRFTHSYKKLSDAVKIRAEERELVFRRNPFNKLLRAHKLHGQLKDKWSFSVDNTYRILFEFDNSDVIFLDVGDHKIYK